MAAWTSPQENEHIVEIERGDGNLPDLLFDLLQCASPNGWEHHIVNLLDPGLKLGRLDDKGNLIIQIGKNPKTLFSAHMDTVHSPAKSCKPENKLIIKLLTLSPEADIKDRGVIWAGVTDEKSKSGYAGIQLGADDKVGCYILKEMIDHDIPGLYIFHVGEECGGVGSKWIAANTPNLLEGIERAVAFDRMHTVDIIGHQRGSRCASIEFMTGLAEQLNKNMPPANKYKPDQHGTFTDTASYMEIIPECTNISVGYENQHTSTERQDIYFLKQHLLKAVLEVEWDKLPTKRDPKARETSYGFSGRTYGGGDYYSSSDYGYWKNGVYIQYERSKTSFKNITRETPIHLLPKWKPADGVPEEVTFGGMTALMLNWIRPTQNPEIAETFASIMIERDALRVAWKEQAAKLIALDTFLGDDPKSGKRMLDAILQQATVKQNRDDLDHLDDLDDDDYSDTSVDKDGYPLTQEERKKRVMDKMVLMGVYVSQRVGTKMVTKQAQEFGQLVGRYNKLKGHVAQSREVISDKLYASINTVFWRMTEIMDHTETTAMADAALQSALDYIKENQNEPGFPKVQAG